MCIVLFFTDLITKLEPSTKARDVHTILARVVLGTGRAHDSGTGGVRDKQKFIQEFLSPRP